MLVSCSESCHSLKTCSGGYLELTLCVFFLDLTHMVHIIDTEHPWDVYSINSGHVEIITCLEWDQSGKRCSNSVYFPGFTTLQSVVRCQEEGLDRLLLCLPLSVALCMDLVSWVCTDCCASHPFQIQRSYGFILTISD